MRKETLKKHPSLVSVKIQLLIYGPENTILSNINIAAHKALEALNLSAALLSNKTESGETGILIEIYSERANNSQIPPLSLQNEQVA